MLSDAKPNAEDNSSRISAILFDVQRRRRQGESLSDAAILARHPDLADALRAALKSLEVSSADGAATIDLETQDWGKSVTPHGSRRLAISCPHCRETVDVAVDSSFTDISCASCGSTFSLVESADETRTAPALKSVGRFDLIERIGVGGFGAVWKGRDRQLDRTVAIKIPRQGAMDERELEKFLREARAAAQLSHPNIVSVHEAGRDGDTVYIVSDYVRGLTLVDWLTGQKPTVRQSAELGATIARALHHAHEHGVIHRDLKPSNILIDGGGQPHLMDFGLARREIGEVTMTMEGQVLGTPAYMSPEQAQGESHTADRRTDVYSLGVVLFELLTGERPFRGNARMLMHQVIHDEAPSPRKLNSGVPRDLETIVLKCLEKNPANRYATAAVVADELERFLRREPILARPVGRLTRGLRWAGRNRAVTALGALLVLALVSAASAAVGYIERVRRAAELSTALHRSIELTREQEAQGLVLVKARDEARKQRELAEAARIEGQRQHAYSLVAEANASIAERDFFRSGEAFREAYEILRKSRASTRPADLGSLRLWDQSPPPIAWWQIEDGIACMAAMPDGNTLLLWHEGRKGASIIDVRTGIVLRTLRAREFSVKACCLLGDGARMAVTDEVGHFEVFDVATQQTLHQWEASRPKNDVSRFEHLEMAASPAGDYIAWYAGGDFSASGWAGLYTSEGRAIWTGKADGGRIAFDRDGKSALLGKLVFDLPEETQKIELKSLTNEISAVFSRPADGILAGGWNGSIAAYDVTTGEDRGYCAPHQGLVHVMRESPDEEWILSASQDGTVQLWRASDFVKPSEAKPVHVYRAGETSQWKIAWLPDSRHFASVERGTLMIWSIAAQAGINVIRTPKPYCTSLAPNGRFLAAVHATPDLKGASLTLFDRELKLPLFTHSMVFDPRRDGNIIRGVVWWTDDSRHLWFLDEDVLRCVELATGAVTRSWRLPAFPSRSSLSISADVVAASHGTWIDVWRLTTGEHLARYSRAAVQGDLRFSPDGNRFVWADMSGTHVAQHQSNTHELIAAVNETTGRNEGLQWIDNRRVLRSFTTQRLVEVFDIDAKQDEKLGGHQRGIKSMTASPEWVVTASFDRTLRLWDLLSRRSVLRMPDAASVCLSHRGDMEQLVVGSSVLGLITWDLDWASHFEERRLSAADAMNRICRGPSSADYENLAAWYSFRQEWDWASIITHDILSSASPDSLAIQASASLLEEDHDIASATLRAARDAGQLPTEYVEAWLRCLATSDCPLIRLDADSAPQPLLVTVEPRQTSDSMLADAAWSDAPRVSLETARTMVGKRAIVAGLVDHVGQTSNFWFLNFDAQRKMFVVVVPKAAFANFSAEGPDEYDQCSLEVCGEVTLFKETPQIVVTHPSQIRIVQP